MSDERAGAEQSMEDILASIRRIISEDVSEPASRQDAPGGARDGSRVDDEAVPGERGLSEVSATPEISATGPAASEPPIGDDLADIVVPQQGAPSAVATGRARPQGSVIVEQGVGGGLSGWPPEARDRAQDAVPARGEAIVQPERTSLRDRMASLNLKGRLASLSEVAGGKTPGTGEDKASEPPSDGPPPEAREAEPENLSAAPSPTAAVQAKPSGDGVIALGASGGAVPGAAGEAQASTVAGQTPAPAATLEKAGRSGPEDVPRGAEGAARGPEQAPGRPQAAAAVAPVSGAQDGPSKAAGEVGAKPAVTPAHVGAGAAPHVAAAKVAEAKASIPSSEAVEVGALSDAARRREAAGSPNAATDDQPAASTTVPQTSDALVEAAREALHSDEDGGRANVRGQTLEEVVREALKPALTAWLDENLPRLIEKELRAQMQESLARSKSRAAG